jgi:hypothetical protein
VTCSLVSNLGFAMKNYTEACKYLKAKGFLVGYASTWKSDFRDIPHPYSIHIQPEKKIIVSIEGYTKDKINQSRIWACWKLKNTVSPEKASELWPSIGGFHPFWFEYDSDRFGSLNPDTIQMTHNNSPDTFVSITAVIEYLESYAQYVTWPSKPWLWFLNPEEVDFESERGKDYATPSEKHLLSCLENLSLLKSEYGF